MQSSQLTLLEQKIIRYIWEGRTNEEAARALGLNPLALEDKVNTIYSKLGIKSRVELLLSICSGQTNVAEEQQRKTA
jgi:DNA-binding CsgD family transcriptional regulator